MKNLKLFNGIILGKDIESRLQRHDAAVVLRDILLASRLVRVDQALQGPVHRAVHAAAETDPIDLLKTPKLLHRRNPRVAVGLPLED